MDEKETDKEKLERARNDVGSALAKTMDLYGITPSIGHLFSRLYFSDEPMTLDELQESMGMSKTSMSTGVRNLEKNKMVKKVWRKGVRKDLYLGEKNFFTHFINFFVPMWRREIEVNLDAINRAEPELQELLESEDSEIKEKAKSDLEKLEEGKTYYNWLSKLADSVESGEIFKLIPPE